MTLRIGSLPLLDSKPGAVYALNRTDPKAFRLKKPYQNFDSSGLAGFPDSHRLKHLHPEILTPPSRHHWPLSTAAGLNAAIVMAMRPLLTRKQVIFEN